MKLTKSGWTWGVRGSSAIPRFRCHREGSSKVALFAAYPRCSADLTEARVAGRTNAAGYSGTPLAKKLGLREGGRVYAVGAPEQYENLLPPLPAE